MLIKILKSIFIFGIICLFSKPVYSIGVHIPIDINKKASINKKNIKKKICISNEYFEDFKINAIRNEMMYASQLCQRQDEYNRVVSADKDFWRVKKLSKWFNSHGGGNTYMRYTTELSNRQSISSIKKFGDQYCEYHKDIFSFKRGEDSQKFIDDNIILLYTPYNNCNLQK